MRSGPNLAGRRGFLVGLVGLVGAPAALRASPPVSLGGNANSLELGFDGFANAPTGQAQYPTYFNGLNGVLPYPVRPPWHVAGVDYRVGINSGILLKDPSAISPAIATSFGTKPIVLSVQADDVTLDAYDFTLGGWWQIRSNGHRNLTISNSRLQNLCIDVDSGPLIVQYCELDGLGLAGETVFGCLAFLRTGVTSIWKYNWFHSAQNDFIDLCTSDIDARFNLFDTMGYGHDAHADAIQFAGDGTASNIKLLFNTYVHMVATRSSPSSFLDLETQIGTGNQVMNNPEIAYNTASNTAWGAVKGSTFFRVAQDVGTINNAYVHDNYADPTNMFSVISDARSPGTKYRKDANIVLTTGRSF